MYTFNYKKTLVAIILKSRDKCNVDNFCTGEEWGAWKDPFENNMPDNPTTHANIDDETTSRDDFLNTSVSIILLSISLINLK